MKTESHTPGPWSAINNGNHWNADITNWIVTYGHDGEQVVDHVYEEADAHLIASAPDLLAALVAQDEADMAQQALDAFSIHVVATDGIVSSSAHMEEFRRLRALVVERKATAKQLKAAALLKAKGSI